MFIRMVSLATLNAGLTLFHCWVSIANAGPVMETTSCVSSDRLVLGRVTSKTTKEEKWGTGVKTLTVYTPPDSPVTV